MRSISCAVLVASAALVPSLAHALSFEIQALIDGRDQLIIRQNTLQWHHFDFAAVGRHQGANAPTVILSEDGGPVLTQNWIPTWPEPVPNEIRFEAVSSVFTNLAHAFPSDGVPWRLTPLLGRGSAEIVQQPGAANAFTLIIEFDDNPFGSSVNYAVQIAPVPEPSTALLLALGCCAAAGGRQRRHYEPADDGRAR